MVAKYIWKYYCNNRKYLYTHTPYLKFEYHIWPNYHTYPYKRAVKQFFNFRLLPVYFLSTFL